MNQPRVIETRQNGPVTVRICGAKRRDGGTCHAPAMANGRCRVHGGKAASGLASGAYKHGRYSKVLPQGLQEDVERLLADGDLLSLRDDIALNAARIAHLLTGLADAETPTGFWEAMASFVEDLGQATNAKDRATLVRVLMAMQNRMGDRQTWREIRETQQTQVKLADTERKRIRDANAFITKEQTMTTIMFLLQTVLEVCGREATMLVGQRMAVLFAAKPGGTAVLEQSKAVLFGQPVPANGEGEDEE